MVGVTTELPEKWEFRNGKGLGISLHRADEFIGGSGVQRSAAVVDDAEVVFVGYGIEAPEEDWDDFKGADLEGKILLMLNDDPDWDPELFAGERKLYYGRWNYKYESAARQGAAGAIIIHTTPSAGYPWQVVQTAWSGEQFELPAGDEPRIQLQAWMTEEAARRLVDFAGHDLDELVEARAQPRLPAGAARRDDLARSSGRSSRDRNGQRGRHPARLGSRRSRTRSLFFPRTTITSGIGEPDETGDRSTTARWTTASPWPRRWRWPRRSPRCPSRRGAASCSFSSAAEEQGLLGLEVLRRAPDHPSRARWRPTSTSSWAISGAARAT